MTFESNITRLPRVFDAERGAEVSGCIDGLSSNLSRLLQGAAGASPFLKSLIEKESDWLPEAFEAPEAALTHLFGQISDTPASDLSSVLRRGKRRVALLTALADIAGVWDLEQVTTALTDFADLACSVAIKAMISNEISRGKLPGATEDDIGDAAGMVCLAMGKMGAYELNYSSDIDLICLFDETRYEPDDFFDVRASLVRATRRAMALLNDPTGEGYVFRTDLRLRPDPAVTPVCMAMEAAERYYESLGRTWERAAYIKARPAAGDLAAGNRFLTTLQPFVWRKHLDFAAIQDAHDMRLRIREHKKLGAKTVLEGHNMKLGRGGIREIEFFTQTRQLIAGGRDRELRTRGTVPSLALLAQKGWVTAEVADKLTDHYRAHREVEHRIQMIHDAQTHDLPKSEEGMQRIACLMGTDVASMKQDIGQRIDEVHALTEDFFAPDLMAPEVADNQGFAFDEEILTRWKTYPALRSGRATEIFGRLRPALLERLERAAKPDEALVALDGFLSGLPAGVQVFSLLEANPQLIDLLTDIAGTAPVLARYLARNSQVFDAVIGGSFFDAWPGKAQLTSDLSARLAAESDYERKLDTARRWTKEWHFRIGVHHLRGIIDAQDAGREYAELAEAVLCAVWPEVVAKFSEKHGVPPGKGAMVLGMGSLGAGRLNAASDLDLIVIYDADGVEMSDGRRALASRAYYARLTQALVTALSAQMAEGRLYEVDMRLRPSGTQGPVATSFTSFKDYQENKAWTWEHLALTRARAVAGAPELMARVETFRIALLARASVEKDVRDDVQEMRKRIADAKGSGGIWDAKLGPGRLQDVELTVQAAALLAGESAGDIDLALGRDQGTGWLTQSEAQALQEAYRLCWTVQQGSRLLGSDMFDPEAAGAGARKFLLRETQTEAMEELAELLETRTRSAGDVIDAVLQRSPGA
ncbi:[glutamate--ammonia-ligase] adenylyltransferase [Cognatishimia sp. WU-CL00825]|uniref:bifunctional [glutamine synthetase] adenylyltransferase/[glutamine synthetase]-adenylyl-L-tyrosine phosphorylase n=1 Tax=Cognatishimia sp. WU-CL00825 TaxID=3127658 RepID=UPI003106B469